MLYEIDKYVSRNGILTNEEIQIEDRNIRNVKRTAMATTLSLGVMSSVMIHNNHKQQLSSPKIEQVHSNNQVSSAVKTASMTKYVNSSDGVLNLRSGRGVQNSVIMSVPNGSAVKVSDVVNGWGRVQYQNTIGYANIKYLSDTETAPTQNVVPTYTAPTTTYQASAAEEKVVESLPYGKEIIKESKKYNIDPTLVAGVVTQESGFQKDITSRTGAKGLMQLMPETAKELGVTDPTNPEQNLDGGIKFLKSLVEKYQDPAYALCAYNGGPGNVDKWKRQGLTPDQFPYQETRDYAPAILSITKGLKKKAAEIDPSLPYKNQIAAIPQDYKSPLDFGDITGKLTGIKIGVDAGHYPKAPGAMSWDRKRTELSFNQEIKNLVVSKLQKAGAIVVDSQGDVKSLGPGQRAQVFDANKVKFAVAMHEDSLDNNTTSGSKTLYEKGDAKSQQLAGFVQNYLGKALPTVPNHGTIERDNLGLFTEGTTPTVITEPLFVSNPYDENMLLNDVVKENIANAIVQGCIDYAEANNFINNTTTEVTKPSDSGKTDSSKVDGSKTDNHSSSQASNDNGSSKPTSDQPAKDNKQTTTSVNTDNQSSQSNSGDKGTSVNPDNTKSDSKSNIDTENSPKKVESQVSDSTNSKDESKSAQNTQNGDNNSASGDSSKNNQNSSDDGHSFIFSKFFK